MAAGRAWAILDKGIQRAFPRPRKSAPVPGDPRIRASDADRDRAAALLREHHAAGRLDAEEFHDRMNKALDAKTLGELDELMTDLPAIDLYQLPDASLRRRPVSR